MKLSKDRTSMRVNDSLTLGGIPADAFQYRLGSKSALQWIIDQYQVNGNSDPNRETRSGVHRSPGWPVIRLSIETVRVTKGLPAFRVPTPEVGV